MEIRILIFVSLANVTMTRNWKATTFAHNLNSFSRKVRMREMKDVFLLIKSCIYQLLLTTFYVMFDWMEWNEMRIRIGMKMEWPFHNHIWYSWEWNGHFIPFLCLVQQNSVRMEWKKSN